MVPYDHGTGRDHVVILMHEFRHQRVEYGDFSRATHPHDVRRRPMRKACAKKRPLTTTTTLEVQIGALTSIADRPPAIGLEVEGSHEG